MGLHSLSQCTGLAGEMLCPFLTPGGAELSCSSHRLWWELRQFSASLQPSACSGQMQRSNSHVKHTQAEQHNSALNVMGLWQGTKFSFHLCQLQFGDLLMTELALLLATNAHCSDMAAMATWAHECPLCSQEGQLYLLQWRIG